MAEQKFLRGKRWISLSELLKLNKKPKAAKPKEIKKK